MLGQKSIFRKEALDQLSSPEQLEQLLQVTNRRAWITLVTIGAALAAVLVWSIFGQIPITVDGTGILIRPRQVVSFQAPASGLVAELNVAVGNDIKLGQVIGRIAQPAVTQALEQERVRLAEAQARDGEVSILRRERNRLQVDGLAQKKRNLTNRIQNMLDIAEQQRARSKRYIAQQELNMESLRKTHISVGTALRERYKSFEKLRKEGLSSDDVVLNARQRVIDNDVQKADLNLRLQEIELKRIEAEDSYQTQLDRIAELRSQVQELEVSETQLQQDKAETRADSKQIIQEIQRNIARFEKELTTKGNIVSDRTGRVIELTVGLGAIVSGGQRLGSIEAESLEGELVGVSFFAVGAGKKLRKGSEIRITPSTVERERFGSVVAVVDDVSSFPVTTEGVTSVVGNAEVARELTQGASRIQVTAKLKVNSKTATGFEWTSGRGPPDPITAGTTATVRATVEYRRPITFVIPLLRQWSGI